MTAFIVNQFNDSEKQTDDVWLRQYRKISPKNLGYKLNKLPENQRWLYSAKTLSNETYHGAKNSISASMLKDVLSPFCSDKYVYEKHIKKSIPSKSASHFIVGSAFHSLTLEPKNFKNEFMVLEGVRRGKAFDAIKEANPNMQFLSQSEFDLISNMRDAVHKNEAAHNLLSDGVAEESIFYRHKSGLVFKARADYRTSDYIVDLKSARDASPKAFTKDAINNGYHIQAAFYMEAFNVDEFAFIVVDKEDPYEVGVYTLAPELIEAGRILMNEAIEHLVKCFESNTWSSYCEDENPIVEIDCPEWLMKKAGLV